MSIVRRRKKMHNEWWALVVVDDDGIPSDEPGPKTKWMAETELRELEKSDDREN